MTLGGSCGSHVVVFIWYQQGSFASASNILEIHSKLGCFNHTSQWDSSQADCVNTIQSSLRTEVQPKELCYFLWPAGARKGSSPTWKWILRMMSTGQTFNYFHYAQKGLVLGTPPRKRPGECKSTECLLCAGHLALILLHLNFTIALGRCIIALPFYIWSNWSSKRDEKVDEARLYISSGTSSDALKQNEAEYVFPFLFIYICIF